MRALIFPNDPLSVYLSKGEIKKLYFNPGNIFREITFINFGGEAVSPNSIKYSTGNANVAIINLPKINIFYQLFPWFLCARLQKLLKTTEVDVVRGFSPFFSGYFAVKMAKFFRVNSLISVHSNFDELLAFYLQDWKLHRYFKYLILRYTVEKHTLNGASLLQPAYHFAAEYCRLLVPGINRIKVVYNRVYSTEFYHSLKTQEIRANGVLKIIAVGNLERRKGQMKLLAALSTVKCEFTLTLVGNGPDEGKLRRFAEIHGFSNKVTFVNSVENRNMCALYQEHDLFALPIEYGGICIPAIESIASGLAVLYPLTHSGEEPELIKDICFSVENTVAGFGLAIQKLADNPEILEEYKQKSLENFKFFTGEKMESLEVENYRSLTWK